jgi:hypothetical protein
VSVTAPSSPVDRQGVADVEQEPLDPLPLGSLLIGRERAELRAEVVDPDPDTLRD